MPQPRMRESNIKRIEQTVARAWALAEAHGGEFRGKLVTIYKKGNSLDIVDCIGQTVLAAYVSKTSFSLVTFENCGYGRMGPFGSLGSLHPIGASIDKEFEKMLVGNAKKLRRREPSKETTRKRRES